jgi:hypothetical protein
MHVQLAQSSNITTQPLGRDDIYSLEGVSYVSPYEGTWR